MARGRLRVMLGAAPGVGKTFTMLEEGRRLLAEGRDVVVAVVETHGRAATAVAGRGARGASRAGRSSTAASRSTSSTSMRSWLGNPPSRWSTSSPTPTRPAPPHAKRWEDVEQLLDAGIDVISTVNIQHIESLNDVVQQITGVPQRETIPDAVLRRADQVELVDLAPAGAARPARRRGVVYPAARVDAALSNYFRLGNLTALRELALLWLADEVDTALQRVPRRARASTRRWEARERIVVALTGGPEGDTLLRRGARIAQRAGGGQLFAVHVATPRGTRRSRRRRALARSARSSSRSAAPSTRSSPSRCRRRSSSSPEASTRPSSSSASAAEAASRRSSAGPGTSASVIRLSGDIDVHIVSHAQAGRTCAAPRSAAPSRCAAGSSDSHRRVVGLPAAHAGRSRRSAATNRSRATCSRSSCSS